MIIGPITRHDRLIGDLSADSAGPTLVCVSSMHGNEPAGVLALERVLTSLADGGLIRGRLVGVIGNLQALNQGRRFIDVDLNRLWLPRVVAAETSEAVAARSEDFEKQRLAEVLGEVLADGPEDHYLLDLHTTSSSSAPFVIAGESAASQEFAELFELPVVLGLEAQLGNTLIDHFINRGWAAAALEAGQHQDAASVDAHESLLWQALEALKCVDCPPPERVQQAGERIREAVARSPRRVRVLYRHPVRAGDEFRMEDGFTNLQLVERGQLLARDTAGVITSPTSGRLLMPLYQPQGEDGFFIVCDL